MELVIRCQNMELTEASRSYAQRRIGKLDRYLPIITKAEVEVSRQQTRSAEDRVVVQVTLNSNGTLIRGEERAGEIREAIDAVLAALVKRIARHKSKLYRTQAKEKAASLRAEAGPPEVGEGSEGLAQVVRVKHFPMKPMFPEEAARQMELLGHNFFLFFNAATEEFNVLYRRRDGDFGLISPELD